jgi:hypothetical protein
MTENQSVESIAQNRALIYKSKGGDVDDSGTWVHRRVALRLAAWLNEDFEAWVYGSIEDLLLTGKVELDDVRLKELADALGAEQAKTEQLSESLTVIAVENAMLEHQYNQALYRMDSAGLLQSMVDDDAPYLYDWEADVNGEEE